jgi:hypothetical protein
MAQSVASRTLGAPAPALREPVRKRDAAVGASFALPLLGALYGSLVIIAVIAVFEVPLGRSLWDDVDAPVRALVAAPVALAAAAVFVASIAALILPGYRSRSLRIAEISAWVIPAWLEMSALVLGAIAFALHHAS